MSTLEKEQTPMAIQMQLWSIQGDRPVRLPSAKLDLEARLEQWICHDLSLVGEDLLLLGNQVATAYGHSIDVLARKIHQGE
jgi:hypothetical protein